VVDTAEERMILPLITKFDIVFGVILRVQCINGCEMVMYTGECARQCPHGDVRSMQQARRSR
jgi:hypothetical protein